MEARKPGHAQMMDSMWDVLGILAANAKPENRDVALGLAAIAVITSGGRAAPGIIKAETSIAKTEGKIIGLGVDVDLALHRGTEAIIYKNAGWQQAGLTKVDWGKAIMDKRSFRSSFTDAAENASGTHFNVTSFNPLYHKPGITNFEFNHIINNPHLLQKTTFIQNGNSVIWNGTKFISK